MRKQGVLAFLTILVGFSFVLSSCEQSTSTEIEESFETIKEVAPIEGAQDITMDLQNGNNQDSYFTVTLGSGFTQEGWCIEWDEPSVQGVQEGVELYTTRGKEAWKELNYFMSIKDDLKAEDPDLTFREIQVIIWSLVDNPAFDVDKIAEYENVDTRIYNNGQPQFDVQKVKDIVSQVKQDVSQAKSKWFLWDFFLIFIKNQGQTIMTKGETAFAYGGEDATCFTDIDNLISNRWGWSNGPLDEGEYEFDMYAGAGQCDLSKGTLVGKLLVDYADGTADVTFQMTETSDFTDELYTMTSTHLYVGNDIMPKKNDWFYTAAPGQYGNVDTHDNVTEFSYSIEGLSGEIYVVGHADVNGFEAAD